jgi:hypothetical protein
VYIKKSEGFMNQKGRKEDIRTLTDRTASSKNMPAGKDGGPAAKAHLRRCRIIPIIRRKPVVGGEPRYFRSKDTFVSVIERDWVCNDVKKSVTNEGPASITSTLKLGFSESRLATTLPAVPPLPTKYEQIGFKMNEIPTSHYYEVEIDPLDVCGVFMNRGTTRRK